MKYVNRVITQAKSADPAQRQLPGLEPMQLLITSEGAAILAEQLNYEKYRGEVARLERRINSYNYKRRKPEYLEQDKRQLAEMKRFDPRFAKYSETSPDLTLVEANSSNPANRRNADGSAERNKVMAHVKRRPLQDVMEDESVKVLQRLLPKEMGDRSPRVSD